MFAAGRSFTEPPGLAHSAFASTSTPAKSRVSRSNRNSGVLPIRCRVLCPNAQGTNASFLPVRCIAVFDDRIGRRDVEYLAPTAAGFREAGGWYIIRAKSQTQDGCYEIGPHTLGIPGA